MNADQQNARDQAYAHAQQQQRAQDHHDLVAGQAGIATGSLYNQVGLQDHRAQQRREQEQAERERAREAARRQRDAQREAERQAKRQAQAKSKASAAARPRAAATRKSAFFPSVNLWFDTHLNGGLRVAFNLFGALVCAALAYLYLTNHGGSPAAGGAWACGAGLLGLLSTRLLIVATKLLALALVLGAFGGVCYGGYLLLQAG